VRQKESQVGSTQKAYPEFWRVHGMVWRPLRREAFYSVTVVVFLCSMLLLLTFLLRTIQVTGTVPVRTITNPLIDRTTQLAFHLHFQYSRLV
jgi:hypothetical protein